MREVKSFGTIKGGKMHIFYRDKFIENISRMDDCRIEIIVRKLFKRRSTHTFDPETGREGRGQNGYYWHILLECYLNGYHEAYGTWIDKKTAHDKLKAACNYVERINEKTGECHKEPQTTSTLTTVEFEEYCERCRQWIFEWFDIIVPLPNEQGKLKLEEITIESI